MENQPENNQIEQLEPIKKVPLVLIILGMAGSGKTTFVESLIKNLSE